MKKGIILILFFISSLVYSQQKETTFEKEGNLVKATYYYENGAVKVQGFFKNKKLSGSWSSFDKQGNKTKIAHYKEGKKVGKWFVWEKEFLMEVNYNDNVIVSVNNWKSESRLAINNE